jgi:hypothetical protein
MQQSSARFPILFREWEPQAWSTATASYRISSSVYGLQFCLLIQDSSEHHVDGASKNWDDDDDDDDLLTYLLNHSMVQNIILKTDCHSACQKIPYFLYGNRT